ncbi:MAG: formate dehydrogenase subunit alpha [Thermodesulfovibrionales bacterium]|nr:formate dehydrogenase subunit alpha [Thermodesulfovibrionales bacterium]
MLKVTIDGKTIEVPEKTTILKAARMLDIYIPTLCYNPKLSPSGRCNLCTVEVNGSSKPVYSCLMPVKDGMEVITTSPQLFELRKSNLEKILADHPNDCMVCEGAGDCVLQELAYFYDIDITKLKTEKGAYRKDNNPFIKWELDKCIKCGLCVKICDEVQGVRALAFDKKDPKGKITTHDGKDMNCEFCGQCVAVCPTSALTGKMWKRKGRERGVKKTDTVCPYCGVGCNITLHVKDNEIVRVTSREDSVVNQGLLCVKGRFAYEFVSSPDRLKTPLIRKNGELQPVSWDEALDYAASRLKEIKETYGPDAIAGLSSARCTTGENYLFQKFMRAAIGTNNVDHCARLCHAPTVASLATIFGSGAMTNSIREIEEMEVIFVIGSNTKEAHPVIANMMIKAYRKGAKIVIADPRKISMSKFAYIQMQQGPGTDIALLNSMAHVILKEGLHNEKFIAEHTKGFEEWKKFIEESTPEVGEKLTGVPKEDIMKAAITFGSSRKAAIYYTMGITQHAHGTKNVNAIANLALLTGNIGREFTGINPLRGQNNVQGACDAGCLPNVYPGYQRVDLPEIQQKFESAWGVPLSLKTGLMATEISDKAAEGKIKAVYIMGENPVLGDPNTEHTIKGFKNLDFLVVQDIFLTETAGLAHVVFPAACFAEKDGTFINTERRVQRVRKAVNPPGEAKEDSWIIAELSRRLGYGMTYNSPEEILEELGSLWPAYEGITYSRIENKGIQWPCPTKNHPGTEFLYKGGFPRGRVSFTSIPFEASAEIKDDNYPFILTNGRNLFHYHWGSMTGRVSAIHEHAGEAYMEINPDDAAVLNIENGGMLKVSSRRGSIAIKARITDSVKQGEVFIPMHYADAAVNILTNDKALDNYAKTPEFKVCAVKIEKTT